MREWGLKLKSCSASQSSEEHLAQWWSLRCISLTQEVKKQDSSIKRNGTCKNGGIIKKYCMSKSEYDGVHAGAAGKKSTSTENRSLSAQQGHSRMEIRYQISSWINRTATLYPYVVDSTVVHVPHCHSVFIDVSVVVHILYLIMFVLNVILLPDSCNCTVYIHHILNVDRNQNQTKEHFILLYASAGLWDVANNLCQDIYLKWLANMKYEVHSM